MKQTSHDSCDRFLVNADSVRAAKRHLDQTRERLFELTETFRILGDPTRLKIILVLKEQELCVCDLASILDVTRSAVSHQLRQLKNLRLVKFRRDGKVTHYSLKDSHIAILVETAMEHIHE